MKVYFAAENQKDPRQAQINEQIIGYLSRSGVSVMSNLADDNLSDFSAPELEKIEQSGEVMLEKIDGLVIEGTRPPLESGYLIALALTHKKPVLYLCHKNKPLDKNLLRLSADKTAGPYLRLESYIPSDLENILADFLKSIETGEGRELPTIKFTLRLTPKIDRYLSWRVHNTKLTKADFLRELVEKLIDGDKDYSRFKSK